MTIPEHIYEQAFRNAPIGLAMSDARGYVLDANDYLLELGGWTHEELKGMMATDFYEDGAAVRHKILDDMRNFGKVEGHEVRFRRKDGSTFLASMSVQAMRVEDQQYIVAYITRIGD